MPLQSDLAEFCIDLKIAPGSFCVTLPGGAELCVQADVDVPDAADAARKLFEEANSAMTPLVPIFNIIDAVVAAKNCLEVVTQPAELAQCIPDLVKKVDALIRLLPQASIPLLAAQIIDSLIAFLLAYRRKIEIMKRRLDAIVRAQTRAAAAGNVQLQTLLDCATGNLDVDLVNFNSQFTPLQRLIGVVNAFMDLAGLPCIPFISGVPDLTDESLFLLDQTILFLQELRKLIPVPTIDTSQPGSFSKVCDTQLPL